METFSDNNDERCIARLHSEGNEDEQGFGVATQTLRALDWILARIVFDVRARTAKALMRDLAKVGIEVPEYVMESAKWFRSFHEALPVADPKNGFLELLSDRLLELGYDRCAIQNAINYLDRQITRLSLDVQAAVARELRKDLESSGVRVPAPILASAGWRDVFRRGKVQLPPGAASIVHKGTDDSLFRPIRE